jgi:4,5-dihydroxyphthalate decarboxylase
MPKLNLTFACDRYVHMKGLVDGNIRPEGIELSPTLLGPGEIFEKLFETRELDVAEMGLSFLLITMQKRDAPYIALPVFPSRSFRHSAIYINAKSGIEAPQDLEGKRIGELHCYGHDAGIWAKGILAEEYGLSPHISAHFTTGGVTRAHAPWGWLPQTAPYDVHVKHVSDRTLDQLLIDGEIDALVSAHTPRSLDVPGSSTRRLFQDSERIERAYFAKTSIFPIMHTVVVRRALYEENPWIAKSLYDAFQASKRQVQDYYREQETQLQRFKMVPWLSELVAENRALFGTDPWPYGIKANRKTLEAFLRHYRAQGLSDRLYGVEELFARETMFD